MNRNAMWVSLGAVLLSACGGSNDPGQSQVSDQAASATQAKEAGSSLPVSQTIEASVDPLIKQGRRVFLQCRSCHTLKTGEAHLTGPNLYQVFGRSAGQMEGFSFSEALRDSGITWSEETLDQWLERPDTMIKGNTMAYAGLRRPADREALIAYLAAETE